MRFRLPKYFPGWFVSGGGGSGGAATVQTDGVTIQGDGSAGNKIAILAVQLAARLTGAGTVASPLDVAGWPLTFYPLGFAGNVASAFAPNVNKLLICGFSLPVPVTFAHMSIGIQTADAGHNYDFGIYSYAGTLQANIGAQALPANGLQNFATVQGAVTLPPGKYFAASTGTAGTATFFASGFSNGLLTTFQFNNNFGSSAGGALPASITSPADSFGNATLPTITLN